MSSNSPEIASPDQPSSITRRLILASASPRRVKLLRDAGYEFEVDPSHIDEDEFPPGTLPVELATYLARMKAAAVAARHRDDVVLAADTVVALGDEIIGKPDDASHAREILRDLAGATHVVITGVAVAIDSLNYIKTARSLATVRMRTLTPIELERYMESGRWRGKAGGYGLQDDDPIVEHLAGSSTNVIGLPMKIARRMLADAGIFPKRAAEPDRRP